MEFFTLASEIALAIEVMLLNLPVSLLVLLFFTFPGLFTYVIIPQERRAQEIERTALDFLRQLSSILQGGLSFENAMEEMAQYGERPLSFVIHRPI